MQFKRARRLSSEGTITHGACFVSVAFNIMSRAREYSNQRLREAGFEAKRSLDDGIRELLKGYRMEGRGLFKNAG